jgi:hypothetical protein
MMLVVAKSKHTRGNLKCEVSLEGNNNLVSNRHTHIKRQVAPDLFPVAL